MSKNKIYRTLTDLKLNIKYMMHRILCYICQKGFGPGSNKE